MRILALFYALAALQMGTAHTVFTTLFINDANQSPGTCGRMPMTPNKATFPINDLKSDDMACGYNGTAGVARVCTIPQAAKLDFLFVEYADNSQPGAIDISHKGPCAVYMKRVESAIQDKAIGDGWFKIWEDTYDAETSQWCTEKLIKNNGMLSVKIPENLAGGYYLIRPELLALHQADKNPPNPQFYLGCAQIFLNSTATSLPKDTVKIPGYVEPTDPAVLFNIYVPKWPYPALGPALYNGSNSVEVKPVDRQTEGLLPYNAVVTNANWWALELDPYSTSDGCKNASKVCFDLTSQCYNSAPPTGSSGCRLWETKCNGVRDACNAGNFNGPPQKNKVLMPGPPGPTKAARQFSVLDTSPTTTPTTAVPTPEPSSSTFQPPAMKLLDTIPTTTSINTVPTPEPSSPTSEPPAMKVSLDGRCGEAQTCTGSAFGDCCSKHNWCGSGSLYCGYNCLADYGTCRGQYKFAREDAHRRRQRSYGWARSNGWAMGHGFAFADELENAPGWANRGL
ncbi:putative endo-beta-1,4-glucanase D [Lachnellula arida]|uniref:AA9 family lytic polysaccharide monooxygenase n=1 Tax=Lachnellula arida TaxID=1316785 RepID=A0A8T9BIN3_9HELO|nr:putative endo-beta-1,4-glucanase D [Lachnellula arida]